MNFTLFSFFFHAFQFFHFFFNFSHFFKFLPTFPPRLQIRPFRRRNNLDSVRRLTIPALLRVHRRLHRHRAILRRRRTNQSPRIIRPRTPSRHAVLPAPRSRQTRPHSNSRRTLRSHHPRHETKRSQNFGRQSRLPRKNSGRRNPVDAVCVAQPLRLRQNFDR